MEYPSVLKIREPIPVPNLPNPSFPAIPSWKWYTGNVPTSLLNNVGSDEDLRKSIEAWYAAKSPRNLLWTPYAQQGTPDVEDPNRSSEMDEGEAPTPADGWGISASMKLRLRQPPTEYQIDVAVPDPVPAFLLEAKKDMTEYIRDIYLFPLHPSANFFLAIDLALYRDPHRIEQYFVDCGIPHLAGHPLEYYPSYYLLFLLTRFASYPFSQDQLILIQLRVNGTDSQKQVIDSIFDLPLTQETLSLVTTMNLPGAAPGWEKFASEYIRFFLPRQIEGVDYLQNDINTVLAIIINWTDQQILALAQEKNLEIPTLTESDSREAWVYEVINMLRRFRRSQVPAIQTPV
jgi:hypothetical protein